TRRAPSVAVGHHPEYLPGMTTLAWLLALAAADPAVPPDASADAEPAGVADAGADTDGDVPAEPAAAAPFDPLRLGPADLPDVGLRYRIEVRFVPEERKLVGQERIEWTNPTGAAVR